MGALLCCLFDLRVYFFLEDPRYIDLRFSYKFRRFGDIREGDSSSIFPCFRFDFRLCMGARHDGFEARYGFNFSKTLHTRCLVIQQYFQSLFRFRWSVGQNGTK